MSYQLTVYVPRSISRSLSASRGRIYLPQDELAQAGLSDEDIFNGKVTDKWRSFMKNQIKRARVFFQEAEIGVTELNQASRWPVRSHYSQCATHCLLLHHLFSWLVAGLGFSGTV